MKELRDKFPSGKVFLALSDHQIAEAVLEIILTRADNTDLISTKFLSVGELENIYDSVSLPPASQQRINYKLMEAYQWLLSEGYMMPAPGQPAGVVTVTPKGRLGLPPESNVENKPLIEWAGGARVTLAIVFTDIVGSTALGVQLGDAAMKEVRRAHFAYSGTLIARHSGREIKTIGDSVMAVFRSAGAALDYAYALHLNPGPSELQVRAGIHIGSVDVVDDDVFGTEVALANRVITAIAGAEIWLSDRAKEDVDRAGVHRGLQWQLHEGVELKGIGPGRLWSLVPNSASVEPQPGKVQAAHREPTEPQSALKIAVGLRGPQLVSGEKTPALAASAVEEPESMHLPRHTTASLAPVAGAQALYKLAKDSMEIVPHILVDVAPAQMAMIEECLEILKVISEQEWSCGYPVASDAHDDADFPEVSRRRRLAELFVLLKGYDIRIVANSEHYEYPLGATPLEGRCTFDRLRLTEAMTSWPRWQVSSYHLVVAFAPPRGEYEEDQVTVPFDRGCEKVLPYKSIGPSTERCEACGSYFFELSADEPGGPTKSRCRSCGWAKDDTERAD